MISSTKTLLKVIRGVNEAIKGIIIDIDNIWFIVYYILIFWIIYLKKYFENKFDCKWEYKILICIVNLRVKKVSISFDENY